MCAPGAAGEGGDGVVGQHHLGPGGQPAEVDQDIGALPGAQQQRVQRHCGIEQPGVGADLEERQHRGAGGQGHAVEAGVGAVVEVEAVQGLIDVQVGPDLAVDHGHIAEELRRPQPVRADGAAVGVGQGAVGVELLVLQDEGELVLADRQPERPARLARVQVVADEVAAGQAGVDVEAGDAQGVVVVPEVAGLLGVAVGVAVAAAGQEGLFGQAVMGGLGVAAVQVDRRPRGGLVLRDGAVHAEVDVAG